MADESHSCPADMVRVIIRKLSPLLRRGLPPVPDAICGDIGQEITLVAADRASHCRFRFGRRLDFGHSVSPVVWL